VYFTGALKERRSKFKKQMDSMEKRNLGHHRKPKTTKKKAAGQQGDPKKTLLASRGPTLKARVLNSAAHAGTGMQRLNAKRGKNVTVCGVAAHFQKD